MRPLIYNSVFLALICMFKTPAGDSNSDRSGPGHSKHLITKHQEDGEAQWGNKDVHANIVRGRLGFTPHAHLRSPLDSSSCAPGPRQFRPALCRGMKARPPLREPDSLYVKHTQSRPVR
ncbi:hypothetical protein RSAG8_05393, partial [Rhizoctonia solani AG-8 WAC10335]